MKILHLYKDYFPVEGGIENHIKQLAEAQAARGHQVSVLITSRDRHTHVETINGVRVIFAARLATISSTPISAAMFALLRREQPDIVHLQFPYPWGEIGNYFFGHARKTVMTYQSDIVRQKYLKVVYAPLMERVIPRVDAIIATSPNYLASSPVLSRFKDKCVVVPLGIDPAPFETSPLTPQPPSPSPDGLDRERGKGVPKGPGMGVRLLFVGRLRYYKGLEYLLEALCELPRVQLIVVGTGPMDRAWRALAQTLGVEQRVAFVGAVRDAELPAYYAACDVFVLPSSERSEAFGLVQLEAMAAGKPVVSTELGTGTSFVNADGETGLVVPARDARALATAITRLIDEPALRARMGAAGRARVRREFTAEKMVDQIMAVCENLILQNK